MRAFRWFDAWVLRGPFVARDVAVYRIVFGVLVLLHAARYRKAGTKVTSDRRGPGTRGRH
jgi:hypothetical protein